MRIYNPERIATADAFLRCFGETLDSLFADRDVDISIHSLPDEENEYHDIVVRLGNCIFLSEKEIGKLGLSDPEIFAAIAHELGHILYHTHPWAYDSEQRADTLAAQLGLRDQMISVIEKIIASRRFRHITAALVQRIQFLQHLGDEEIRS